MTKIRDIVQINGGYTSYVDLHEDYYDIGKNRGRMERYKPIAAHRLAFEKIANSLNPTDRRFYFLSGSYGTGKSHLLLMLANYFANPSDLPEIEAFFRNYETAQGEVLLKPGETLQERKARSLKDARKTGRFLVALCRYNLNLDFEGTLLRALEESLKKDESSIMLDTHYREALRRIKDWEVRRNETRFYNDLQTAISQFYPDWTINDLIAGLERFDGQALTAFKSCFQAVTDAEFAYKKDNLRDIITDFLANPEFKERYKGIVFLYDEFGAAIDNKLVNYSTLLDFAQFCANSTLDKGGTVVFVGTGHKGFRNHGQIGDLNAETLEARVTEIGLKTQGMEDIISAIVQPKRESPEYISQVASQSGTFTWFSNECKRLNLFNWLPAPKIKNNIIQNIYPIHPLATYSLLRLASEAGSDNRSVFKFFAPEFDTGEQGWKNVQPYSYPAFVEGHDITENNKLALYTTDLLVDYFNESLKAGNSRLVDRVKTAVVNYEATLRELNAYLARKSQDQLFEELDPLMVRILKAMLVNEVASTQDAPIANTAQNLEFALDAVSPDNQLQVKTRLEKLCAAGILYDNKGVYELMRGDRKDVKRLVEQFKANPENRPTNVLVGFLKANPMRGDEAYLEAKDYQSQTQEDKRLKVVFASPSQLSEKKAINGVSQSFFAALEHERRQVTNAVNSYEGVAVYVFCETESDLDAAKKAAAQNDQPRVVVAIPRSPIHVYDALFTLTALDSDTFKKQSEDFGPYERAEEKKIRDDATKALADAKADYFSNSKVYWFGVRGAEIPVQASKRHDVATRMMTELYGAKRNSFGHNEFNKIHINLTSQVRAVFKEAGDILCDVTQPIRINWGWPDNRGGKRYLRFCFVDHQALRVLNTEGDIRYFEPEKDLDRFRSALPAYANLLEEIAKLEGKGQVNLLQFIRPLFEDYGQGEIAVTLMLLLARRFYGDSLRFKREPNNLVDIQFSSTEDMLALVQGQSPSAVILYEKVSAEDQAYFAKLTQIFSSNPIPAGKAYSVAEAFQALTHWWEALPVIARASGFYSGQDKSIAEALSQAKTRDPFRFVKHDLLELLGQIPGDVLAEEKLVALEATVRSFKGTAENIQLNVEQEILDQFARVFGSSSPLDVDIQESMRMWYAGLSSTQKDPLGNFHNNDSKPLIKFTSYANIRDLLFKMLPDAYSFGYVETWSSNLVTSYIGRVEKGKEHIEKNAPQVGQLKVTFGDGAVQNGNQVTYKGELVLHVETEDGQGVIYYTDDGSDPMTSKSRHKLTPGEKLDVKGNRQVRLVVADGKGNYSAVKVVEAIDELQKYKIARQSQQAFEERVSFIFPATKDTAWTTISSFITELRASGLYGPDELRQVILHALDEILKQK